MLEKIVNFTKTGVGKVSTGLGTLVLGGLLFGAPAFGADRTDQINQRSTYERETITRFKESGEEGSKGERTIYYVHRNSKGGMAVDSFRMYVEGINDEPVTTGCDKNYNERIDENEIEKNPEFRRKYPNINTSEDSKRVSNYSGAKKDVRIKVSRRYRMVKYDVEKHEFIPIDNWTLMITNDCQASLTSEGIKYNSCDYFANEIDEEVPFLKGSDIDWNGVVNPNPESPNPESEKVKEFEEKHGNSDELIRLLNYGPKE